MIDEPRANTSHVRDLVKADDGITDSEKQNTTDRKRTAELPKISRRLWSVLSALSTLHWVAAMCGLTVTGSMLAALAHKALVGTVSFFTMALSTVPLTAAVAIIGVGIHRKWFSHPIAFIFACAVTLFATGYIARVLEVPDAIEIEQHFTKLAHSFQPSHDMRDDRPRGLWVIVSICFDILRDYLHIYGLLGFAISIATGCLAAFLWTTMTESHNRGFKIR